MQQTFTVKGAKNQQDDCGQIVYVAQKRRWPRCGLCIRFATWVAVAPYWYEVEKVAQRPTHWRRLLREENGEPEKIVFQSLASWKPEYENPPETDEERAFLKNLQKDSWNQLANLRQDQTEPRAAFGCESCLEQMEITGGWYWFQLDRIYPEPENDSRTHTFRDHLVGKRWGPAFLGWLEQSYDLSKVPAGRVPFSKKERFEILKRDDYTCRYCGKTRDAGAVLHVDHVKPVAMGGTNDPSNLVTACADCNHGKGARPL